MNKFDLNSLTRGLKVHFIGVGGISMSALAEIMLSKGFNVSGSDMNKTPLIDRLIGLGLEFLGEHHAKNVINAGLVVYTAAISADNPELKQAEQSGIKAIERPILLGAIMKNFPLSIAISGTHGKTTTTSMMAYILLENNTDPTILVGGELPLINGNIRTGKSDYFLAEACEYHRSFLEFSPFGVAMLNIEPDHLDYYKDEADYISAFEDFSKIIPQNGFLAINADDSNSPKITTNLNCRIIKFGIDNDNALICAKNLIYNEGIVTYDLFIGKTFAQTVTLSVGGRHNVYNSLGALSCSFALGLDMKTSVNALNNYAGVGRRFELKGSFNGITVVDDYAHHPTEVKATLESASNMGYKRVWCAFQPHTYSRTKTLLEEFSTAFANAHKVLLTDIYAAREIDDGSISSKVLADAINTKTNNAEYLESFDAIKEYLTANASQGDLIITMGAGDIFKLSNMLLHGKRINTQYAQIL